MGGCAVPVPGIAGVAPACVELLATLRRCCITTRTCSGVRLATSSARASLLIPCGVRVVDVPGMVIPPPGRLAKRFWTVAACGAAIDALDEAIAPGKGGVAGRPPGPYVIGAAEGSVDVEIIGWEGTGEGDSFPLFRMKTPSMISVVRFSGSR